MGIHHMRHAYGTSLAEIGVYERVAQYLLGHADSRVTKEIYQHVTGSMLDSAASAIDQVVADAVTSARGVQEWVQRQRNRRPGGGKVRADDGIRTRDPYLDNSASGVQH